MLKEDIQAISQIIQAGYLSGDFSAITDWSVLNTTDPIVQYFTSRLGGVTKQCPMGTVTPPCNIRHATFAPTHTLSNHAARWVMMNGTTLSLSGAGNANQTYILWTINSKPQLNDGIGKQMAIVCNVSDSSYSPVTGTRALNPAQCGPWWPESHSSNDYYSLTWEKLFS